MGLGPGPTIDLNASTIKILLLLRAVLGLACDWDNPPCSHKRMKLGACAL